MLREKVIRLFRDNLGKMTLIDAVVSTLRTFTENIVIECGANDKVDTRTFATALSFNDALARLGRFLPPPDFKSEYVCCLDRNRFDDIKFLYEHFELAMQYTYDHFDESGLNMPPGRIISKQEFIDALNKARWLNSAIKEHVAEGKSYVFMETATLKSMEANIQLAMMLIIGKDNFSTYMGGVITVSNILRSEYNIVSQNPGITIN